LESINLIGGLDDELLPILVKATKRANAPYYSLLTNSAQKRRVIVFNNRGLGLCSGWNSKPLARNTGIGFSIRNSDLLHRLYLDFFCVTLAAHDTS
jgi:hypothetical protein